MWGWWWDLATKCPKSKADCATWDVPTHGCFIWTLAVAMRGQKSVMSPAMMTYFVVSDLKSIIKITFLTKIACLIWVRISFSDQSQCTKMITRWQHTGKHPLTPSHTVKIKTCCSKALSTLQYPPSSGQTHRPTWKRSDEPRNVIPDPSSWLRGVWCSSRAQWLSSQLQNNYSCSFAFSDNYIDVILLVQRN